MRIQQTNYFSMTTPQGTGGIGIIELFGRDALKIIGEIFRSIRDKKIHTKAGITHPYPSQEGIFPLVPSNKRGFRGVFELKPNRIYLGNIIDCSPQSNQMKKSMDSRLRGNDNVSGGIIDQVIIHFTPAQNSLTRLDTVEINAHGGIMPCRLIGRLLKKLGVKELSQPEVIDLAHKQGKLDKIQAEALEYLLQAQTPLAAAVLLDQYNGALSKTLKLKKNHPELQESARFGIALTHPKRILILGKPNVGKSTLFNALLGQDRAITHHLPGTTRDIIEDALAIDGFPFVLVDTAGLRKSTKDAIEKIGMAYARKEIPKAEVIVLVTDTDNPELFIRNPGKQENESWIHCLLIKGNSCSIKSGKRVNIPVIIVRNKADLLTKVRNAEYGTRNKIVYISALKRTGIDRLRKEILEACKLDGFRHKPGQPIIFSRKQLSLIY